MLFKSYALFINEDKDVELKGSLKEFILIHKSESLFELKSDNFLKTFSVEPFRKKDLNKLQKHYNKLIKVIDNDNAYKIFLQIKKAEQVNYKYGRIFNSKFSLENIPNLDINLSDEHVNILQTSEDKFMKDIFHRLSKNKRTYILNEMINRAQILCCVIEALFYFVRQTNKDEYYNGMNIIEILELIKENIEKASKDNLFSFKGPFSDESKNALSDDKQAFWICEKNLKEFVIFNTIDIKELYNEDGINGINGLKASLKFIDKKFKDKDFNFFNIEELSSRIKLFIEKYNF